jgi:8-oxo-dGTP pyrophosphatase MutT (NUDIX family)
VTNKSNEILVVVPTWRSTYDLPGGGIEPTETIPEGIARECYEESGYRVKVDSATPFYVSETEFYHTDHKKFYHSVNMYYRCSLLSDEQNTAIINTVEEDEIDKVEWKKLADISLDNCHEMHYQALIHLKNN